MNLEELDDLDALLESRYENDLEDQILELESGNENLDETFGDMSLDLPASQSIPATLLPHEQLQSWTGMHPGHIQHATMAPPVGMPMSLSAGGIHNGQIPLGMGGMPMGQVGISMPNQAPISMILELESGNENLDETFGDLSLDLPASQSIPPTLLPHEQLQSWTGMHPGHIQHATMAPPVGMPMSLSAGGIHNGQIPLGIGGITMGGMPIGQMQMGQVGLSMPNQAPISMQMAMPQHISMQMAMPGMGHVPMGQRQVKIENMMTMEDVENLLKSQRKVEEIRKVEVTPKVQEDLKETAVNQKEIHKEIPKEIKVDSKKDSRENLTNVKEKKNRVHLEKIQRASQAERRMDKSKNKNLQGFFYKKESDGRSARKKDVFITKWEKELIAKIQISQLISNDPMKDDFYYEIYSSFSKKPEEAPVKESGKSKKRASGVNKIQQQMTRLIEKRKSKITEVKGPMSLEGALGKISVLSSRNPRQVLSLDTGFSSSKEKSKVEFSLSPKSVLNSIERVYDNILELESLKRSEKENEENLECLPHAFGFFLKYSKGIRIIPRVLKYLNPDQQFKLFSTLMCRLECVEIANLPVSTEKLEIDTFMAYVIPPFVDYVSEIGLESVNSLMKTILERHNMVWVATSKIGLAFLTAFLSRAELLKQGASQKGAEGPNENDLTLWNDIYNFLFSSIQGSFSSLFPAQKSDKESLPGEIYIWQFLASLAVCATNVDQQTVLVSEVRDNIIATAKMSTDAKALANVDLFLTALGLGIDASQLASSV